MTHEMFAFINQNSSLSNEKVLYPNNGRIYDKKDLLSLISF